jgi:putative RNA 2'-phosphotransferase
MKELHDKRISKLLSLILRHKPETIGLTLDENGWANTEELLKKIRSLELIVTFELLKTIVETNDKKRFIFSSDFNKIRANQGHSNEVDLQLEAVTPPDNLYHGTAEQNIESIKLRGLLKGGRHHVHLSNDRETARKVGIRYGKPVILVIDTKRMSDDGYKFYKSENDVWLTDHVSPQYIKFEE